MHLEQQFFIVANALLPLEYISGSCYNGGRVGVVCRRGVGADNSATKQEFSHMQGKKKKTLSAYIYSLNSTYVCLEETGIWCC